MKKKKTKRSPLFFFLLKMTAVLTCAAVSFLMALTVFLLAQHFGFKLFDDLQYIIIGFALYIFLHPFVRRKPFLYILGHELTHVIFVWISHGWADSIKIKKSGGSITANKDNIFITLSPYFFPLYAVSFLLLYLIFSALTEKSLIFCIIKTIIGLAAGFHFLFTAEMLMTKQEDFQVYGRLFSTVIIICLNLVMFSVFLVMMSKQLDAEIFFEYLKISLLFVCK